MTNNLLTVAKQRNAQAPAPTMAARIIGGGIVAAGFVVAVIVLFSI